MSGWHELIDEIPALHEPIEPDGSHLFLALGIGLIVAGVAVLWVAWTL